MVRKSHILGLLSAFLLLSCISRRSLMQEDHVVTRDISAENINGNYSNKGDSLSASYYFYEFIIDYNSRILRKQKDNTFTDSTSVINLKYDGNKLLTIRVFQHDSLVRETAVKVKQKGDVLLFKRHFFLIPIPVLFFFHDERRIALVSGIDGNLHVYKEVSTMGWVLMAAGQDFANKQVFRKLK